MQNFKAHNVENCYSQILTPEQKPFKKMNPVFCKGRSIYTHQLFLVNVIRYGDYRIIVDNDFNIKIYLIFVITMLILILKNKVKHLLTVRGYKHTRVRRIFSRLESSGFFRIQKSLNINVFPFLLSVPFITSPKD